MEIAKTIKGGIFNDMRNQIVGTLGDEAYNCLLIVLVTIFANKRFVATLQLTEFPIKEVRKTFEVYIAFSCHRLASFVVVAQVPEGNQDCA